MNALEWLSEVGSGDVPDRSPIEQIDQPSGSSHVGSQGLGLLAQRAIRGHQCHLTGRIRGDRQERVVTATGRMNNGDAVSHAWFDAIASFPFEDHDYGVTQSSRPRQSTNSLHERSGCFWSIPPPTVWT